MSKVDLNKYREQLMKNYKEVSDPKNSTNWALFGYEGQSNTLKVEGKGDGGLSELVDELNSSKIMYAYCRVIDPNTKLPKFVLVNWQGEACPENRKGSCANHLRDVQDFFRGIHLTINARSEDELDEDDVQKKVAQSSGANYSFHKEAPRPMELPKKPVSSVYQRTVPQQEIKVNEREQFWEKEQEEQKHLREEDEQRKRREQQEIERERKEKELQSETARDHQETERLRKIREQKLAEKKADSHKERNEQQWQREQQDVARETEERHGRSDVLGRERAAEAQALIGASKQQAKAVFEPQHSQFDKPAPVVAPPARKLKDTFAPAQTQQVPVAREPIDIEREKPSAPLPVAPPRHQEEAPQVRNLLAESLPARQRSDSEGSEEEGDWESEPPHPSSPTTAPPPPEDIYDDSMTDEVYSDTVAPVTIAGHQITQDMGLCAQALYDYQAMEENELSFDPEDLITNIERIDDGWWVGTTHKDEKQGMFPANYVKLINDV